MARYLFSHRQCKDLRQVSMATQTSFIPKFSVNTSDCTKLLITDPTGIYSATNPQNLFGWGGVNPSILDVQTAVLQVTTKDTAIPYEINVFPTLPNVTGAIYTLLPTQIGYTTKIPTQILTVKYTVTGILVSGTPFTYDTWCYILVDCDLQCCVNQLIEEATSKVACECEDATKCKCQNNGQSFKAIQANILLIGLRKLVKNKLLNKANVVLSVLQNICNCK